MKRCSKCSVEWPLTGFVKDAKQSDGLRSSCKACTAAWRVANRTRLLARDISYRAARPHRAREWLRANPQAVRTGTLRRGGLLTNDEYEQILEAQRGLCAICGQPETVLGRSGSPRRLAIDHCHANGHVRGLLCARCNTAIGLLSDDTGRLAAAIAYLKAGTESAR